MTLEELFDSTLWVMVAMTALFGALGGAIHRWSAATNEDPSGSWWQRALTGAVAALGTAYAAPPAEAFGKVALAVLSGFLARSLLSALEARIKLEVSRDERSRALRVADNAVRLTRALRATPEVDQSPTATKGTIDEELNSLDVALRDLKNRSPA